MADNSTIGVDLGGGLITTSGATNSDVLQALANFIVAQNYTFESLSKAQLPAPANVFFTLTGDPVITLPANSPGGSTAGFSATISGGGPTTAIIAPGGDLTYTGAAGNVFANIGTGTIDDTAAAASISAVDGTYIVTGTGADTFLLGGPAASVTASSGGFSSATLEGGVSYTAGTSDTITATTGTSTVYGTTGDSYTGNAASVFFVGVGTANTVFGGTGADTVYGNGTTYFGGSNANVFASDAATSVAGSASTIYGGAAGATTIQAGLHGDLVNLQGAADRVVSGGGKDTIWGGATGGIAPTIFGTNNSYELMVSGMKGGLIIGLGDNTTLDGANTTGGLNFFSNPGYGNQTFIGSATGSPDTFYIGAQTVGTSLITIQNWHSGDSLNLSAFGAADQATVTKAFASGQNLFKLSDGTTVVFNGSHPTAAAGSFYS